MECKMSGKSKVGTFIKTVSEKEPEECQQACMSTDGCAAVHYNSHRDCHLFSDGIDNEYVNNGDAFTCRKTSTAEPPSFGWVTGEWDPECDGGLQYRKVRCTNGIDTDSKRCGFGKIPDNVRPCVIESKPKEKKTGNDKRKKRLIILWILFGMFGIIGGLLLIKHRKALAKALKKFFA